VKEDLALGIHNFSKIVNPLHPIGLVLKYNWSNEVDRFEGGTESYDPVFQEFRVGVEIDGNGLPSG
jgi:hypothetical protein